MASTTCSTARSLPDGTYAITATARAGCAGLLGGVACPSNQLTLATADDGTGNQRWNIAYQVLTALCAPLSMLVRIPLSS